MIPWKTVSREESLDGSGLILSKRGEEWAVRTRGRLLMTSRTFQSEAALALLSLGRVKRLRRVLVGGLGFGYTLRSVLDRMPEDGQVVVVEFSAALIGWNRGPLAYLADCPLEDRRVQLRLGDVRATIAEARSAYDAILLDVDNGPTALVHPGNANLYDEAGVRSCLRALTPGGVLGVWSAGADEAYLARLQRQAQHGEAHTFSPGRGGNRHVIFLASKGAA